jgi:hypothetical protein
MPTTTPRRRPGPRPGEFPGKTADAELRRERASKAGRARTGADYHIAKLAEAAPDLTAEQRDKLATVLRTSSTA